MGDKMKKCGIYKITNLVNGYFYIGSSVDINSRFGNHRYTLRNNNHNNPKLQNAWNKYGEQNFVFDIIKLCARDQLYTIEQKYLNKIKLSNRTYNLVFVVGGFPDSSGNKNPRWINVTKKQKNLIKNYWQKFHTIKTIKFMKTKFGYGGSIARRIIKEIKQELNIPNKTKDNKIYNFRNIINNQTFTGTRQQFIKYHNILYTTVSELILGKISKTRTGWVVFQFSKT